ncbi:hypothetical protein GOP47_0030162 [Adiantum capillus-veneris]|nr:hypothetical protein GOP47_0030162 [Adiantum capillus-veneris]
MNPRAFHKPSLSAKPTSEASARIGAAVALLPPNNPGRLFYDLQPSDLSDSFKITRWKSQSRVLQLQDFMSFSGWDFHNNLDISSWLGNLAKLTDRSGVVRTLYRSNYDYIQVVVPAVCARLTLWMPVLMESNTQGR